MNIIELCQHYARGHITRADLIDRLATFPYVQPETARDLNDDVIVQPPNTIHDVLTAARHGLIDDSIYTELVDRLT
jgi:hypothetical protein